MKIEVLLFAILNIVQIWTHTTQNDAILWCITNTGIDEKIVHQIGLTLSLPDTNQVKKFLVCFHKKMGYQNSKGQMMIEKIRENLVGLTTQEVNSVVSSCKHVKASSDIETSYLITKCLFRKIKAVLKKISVS